MNHTPAPAAPQPAQPSTTVTLVWFRDDLRLADNPALTWAAQRGAILPLIIDEEFAHPDPSRPGTISAVPPRAHGGAAAAWRRRSIAALRRDLQERGLELLHVVGDPLALIPEIVAATGATAVTWNRRYHQPYRDRDAVLKAALNDSGILAHSEAGNLLLEPWEVSTRQGEPYKVYTPFSKAAMEVLASRVETGELTPLPIPESLTPTPHPPALTTLVRSHGVTGDEREPTWATSMLDHWHVGETGAQEQLERFLSSQGWGSRGYAEGRDFPAEAVTSRLSPHLRFGEISVRTLWHAAEQLATGFGALAVSRRDGDAAAPAGNEDVLVFRKELLWRDFAWHRLYHIPDMTTRNVRPQFDAFPWSWADASALTGPGQPPKTPRTRVAETDDHAGYKVAALAQEQAQAWALGRTGIPLVDAGMRELWATGTMHNRVRMVVASLLTKNLGIHWRVGEEWFWETLVDADPASNPFNWQWVAGCGDDAAPYFRIFNPEAQAKKFDGGSVYTSAWVDTAAWDYPRPIVDLKESRAEALAAYEVIK